MRVQVLLVQVCLADLQHVMQLDPQSIEAADLIEKVQRSWAKAQKEDRALYGDMLSSQRP